MRATFKWEDPRLPPPSAEQILDMLPSEPGKNQNQEGFEQLCTRWNREEAEAVELSKRTLQSAHTTKEAKMRGLDELEYWALRRGGYDAEIILLGALRHPDKDIVAQAHISLKKTWGAHFNAWVNSVIGRGKVMQKKGQTDEALKIFDKVIFENPLWGEGYHLRAKIWNQLKDVNRTVADLRSALEFCPNNYVVMTELALTLMDKLQAYEEADRLLQTAADLCPILPIGAITAILHDKAPHLKAAREKQAAEDVFSPEKPPGRLLPERWVSREEASERPNQLFLRVGGELEQWFADLRTHDLSRGRQRKLWSMLVIAWDPDKHPRELRSFTTQVHEAIKARGERQLARVTEDGGIIETQAPQEDDDDARLFLQRIRRERREQRERKAQEAAA